MVQRSDLGGRALISGNTFLMNRHAIAAGGEVHERYRASYNLVLSQAPATGLVPSVVSPTSTPMTSICMARGSGGFGGLSGEYLDIRRPIHSWAHNRHNFEWRGVPCYNTQFSFQHLASESDSDALNFKRLG